MDAPRIIAKAGQLKYSLSATDLCVAEVQPGEQVTIECEINCNEGLITSTASKLSLETVRFPFVNPATGPLRVVGAKREQVLAVQIHAMELDEIGYTALWPGIGMFPDWIRQREFGIQTRVMKVHDGFVHWSENRKLPIKPMIGVLGVAPVLGSVPTVDNGPHGGNLDVQEITTSSTVLFEVQQEGASLYVGAVTRCKATASATAWVRLRSARV